MIIKTKDFQEATNKILLATELDKTAANLEINVKPGALFLNVTNKEYYVSVKFPIEGDETFRAVVDASLFLSLISGITAETFKLVIKDTNVVITANKSRYTLPMIYANDQLMELPFIGLQNKTVEMTISNDILQSILLVNSKELLKVKNIDVNPLQKLYYITEKACFTFTTGACVNEFKPNLEKQINILLNERIVKLFKLFKEDVWFSLAQDTLLNGINRTKVSFETNDVYVAAILPSDDRLLDQVKGPVTATKSYTEATYAHKAVLKANDLADAISRLMLFTKNSVDKANMTYMPVKVVMTPDEFTIYDSLNNCEVIDIQNGSEIYEEYEMKLNIVDLKLIIDSCKNEDITLNCGNHAAVVIKRGNISNLIPELKTR